MNLLIYGAGAAGLEIYDLVVRNNMLNDKYASVCFMLDDEYYTEGTIYGAKAIKFSASVKLNKSDYQIVVGVGEPSARKKMYDKARSEGFAFGTLIDQTAIVSSTATLDEGCVVYAGAVISSEAHIKSNCMIMFHSIIGHHANIGENCVVCPKANVGGFSRVGAQSFIGLGSSMLQHANVGSNAIVGLGSVVFRDVEDGTVVVGNPARVTKGRDNHQVF